MLVHQRVYIYIYHDIPILVGDIPVMDARTTPRGARKQLGAEHRVRRRSSGGTRCGERLRTVQRWGEAKTWDVMGQ